MPSPSKASKDSENESNPSLLKLAETRAGGTYLPPAKLRQLQSLRLSGLDPGCEEVQKEAWEALKKSLNGLINKVNVGNIKMVLRELFMENLIRGRGLFCKSIVKAQGAALPFTKVYACLVAVINSKLPKVGKLLVKRLVLQFRRSYKRNDKKGCLSSLIFIAHLVNQGVCHEILALQILALLLVEPTDDSVELAVGFVRECGQHLGEYSREGMDSIFERFRAILHEGKVQKRVMYMVEVLFQVRKTKFADHPAVPEELDLVEDEDKIPHDIRLDAEFRAKDELNVFRFDSEYLKHEEEYEQIKKEILGEEESEEEEEGEEDSEDETTGLEIQDRTGTNVVNLRKSVFLTIMSSVDFEECCHKLLRLNIQPGDELEISRMVVETCSQERSYTKFYGLLAERFCKLTEEWAQRFEQCFVEVYESIHRYESNRLRNVATLFAHLFAQDALPWAALSIIKLNEEDTTSSSRIFIKIVLTFLSESLGTDELLKRFKDPVLSEAFEGLFPTDNPRDTRFAINYFTSIGLGALTDDLREQLNKMSSKKIKKSKREADSSD